MPVTGMSPVTAAMFMTRLHDDQRRQAAREQPAERGPCAPSAMRMPAYASTTNADDDRERADEPELLADDGEDEVGVRRRQVEVLLPRQPEARRRCSPPEPNA